MMPLVVCNIRVGVSLSTPIWSSMVPALAPRDTIMYHNLHHTCHCVNVRGVMDMHVASFSNMMLHDVLHHVNVSLSNAPL
jgi:hypothetical protein